VSVIAGLQDFRQEGPPADIGTFQMPTGIFVCQHTFAGATYICEVRAGQRGWVLLNYLPLTAANNSTVIQDAINQATEVTLAGGTYLIATRLDGVSNLTLRGFGVTVLRAVTGGMEMIRFWEKQNIHIEGIFFDGNSQAVIGIRFDATNVPNACKYVSVVTCWFNNFTGANNAGIFAGDPAATGGGLDNSIIIGCFFLGGETGFRSHECYRVSIVACYFDAPLTYSCFIRGHQTTTTGCTGTGCAWYTNDYGNAYVGNASMDVTLGSDARLNTIADSDFEFNSIGISVGAWENVIIGNVFYKPTYEAIDCAGYRNIISDNIIFKDSYGWRHCIRITGHHNLVNGNEVRAAVDDGIFLDGADDNIIINNKTYANGRYGINISNAACDRNRVFGNVFEGDVTAGFNDGGTGTILPTIVIPFVDGTDPQDSGFLIDAAAEFARAFLWLPLGVQQVVRMKVYARAAALSATTMAAEFVIYGAADNEAYTTHNGSVTNHPSTSSNFAADDVIYWTITTAGVLALLGGDSVEVKVLYNATAVATNAYFRAVAIEYV